MVNQALILIPHNFDDAAAVLTVAALYQHQQQKKNKKKSGSCSVKPWLTRQQEQEMFVNLLMG